MASIFPDSLCISRKHQGTRYSVRRFHPFFVNKISVYIEKNTHRDKCVIIRDIFHTEEITMKLNY